MHFQWPPLAECPFQVELNLPTLASKAPSTFVSLANFEKFFMQQVKEQSFRVFFALFSLTAASDYSHQLGPQTLEAPKK